jgi:hypothetical protein
MMEVRDKEGLEFVGTIQWLWSIDVNSLEMVVIWDQDYTLPSFKSAHIVNATEEREVTSPLIY